MFALCGFLWNALARAQTAPVILAFGDSLTSGYGLPKGESFPAQLEAYLRHQGVAVRVVNGGVAGDTTEDGRNRLAWALAVNPRYVILELGANDALRGLNPKQTKANLRAILDVLQRRKIKVLLAGMKAPGNLGEGYDRAFDGIYPQLAREYNVVFYRFFLAGVALHPKLNQKDGIHPNARGVARIVRRIAPYVRRLLDLK